MDERPSEDVPLFSKRMLEGEYATYNFTWSRNYGALVQLDSMRVDNYGNVYANDLTNGNAYYRTFAGVETNTAAYRYWLETLGQAGSDTIKYVAGTPALPLNQFDVWRDGVLIFSRVVTLDEPLINTLFLVDVSPNGKFIAIIALDAITGLANWLILYEGV